MCRKTVTNTSWARSSASSLLPIIRNTRLKTLFWYSETTSVNAPSSRSRSRVNSARSRRLILGLVDQTPQEAGSSVSLDVGQKHAQRHAEEGVGSARAVDLGAPAEVEGNLGCDHAGAKGCKA